IACIDRVDETASLSYLRGQLLHAHATEVTAEGLHANPIAGTFRASHVVHSLAVGSRNAEALGLAALPERSDGFWPRRGICREIQRRTSPAGERVPFERIAFALIELFRGVLERPREPIELTRCRIPETAIEERGRDPDGRGKRQQC